MEFHLLYPPSFEIDNKDIAPLDIKKNCNHHKSKSNLDWIPNAKHNPFGYDVKVGVKQIYI